MKIYKKFTIEDVDLIRTCEACPEQYDVFIKDIQIGYLRLRHGVFTVRCPDFEGKVVYTASPKGDGLFYGNERKYYLDKAKDILFKNFIKNEKTI